LHATLAESGIGEGSQYLLSADARKGNVTITDPETGAFEYVPYPAGPGGRDTFAYTVQSAGSGNEIREGAVVVNPRVMPLGDEITDGVVNAATGLPEPLWRIGYRRALYQRLNDAGYRVDFVGSARSGEGFAGFDPDHEGQANAPAREIAYGSQLTGAGGVYARLQANPADVILMHIGTHGLSPGADGVRAVLDEIDRWERSPEGNPVTVLVATIIDWSPPHPDVERFNASVAEMVRARTTDPSDPAYPDQLLLVDQHSALAAGHPRADGLHPFQSGYDAMSDIWFDALTGARPEIVEKCP